nr:PREDICTED: esterase AGAP003155-like [Daucus carota subsp. sativus]
MTRVFLLIYFHKGSTHSGCLTGNASPGCCSTKVQDLKCVVVICGGKFASVEIATPKLAENAFSSLIQTPSLHIFGENDFAKLGAIELLESFVDPFVILHPGGHEVPELDEKGVKVMNSFLDKVQASFAAPKVIRSLM